MADDPTILDLLEGFLGGIQGILLRQLLPFAYPVFAYARTPDEQPKSLTPPPDDPILDE